MSDARPEPLVVPPGPPGDPQAEQRLWRRLRGQYVRKVGFTTTALVSAGVGALFTVLFVLDFEAVLRVLERADILARVSAWLTERFPTLADTVRAALSLDVARLAVAALLNAAVFLLVLLGVLIASFIVARRVSRRGDFSRYGRFCLSLCRGSVGTGLVLQSAGTAVIVGGGLLALRNLGVTATLPLVPLAVGLGLGLMALGLAVTLPLTALLDDPEALPAPEPPAEPAPGRARASGRELLAALRESPVFRRQVFVERTLPAERFIPTEEDGLALLLRRFPRLVGVVGRTGITRLSSDQTNALQDVLAAETRPDGDTDHVFVGWPGSGRTTLANLLALGAVLHREGAMYCVTAESAQRSVDSEAAQGAGATARHPATQLRRWLAAAGLEDVVRVREAYLETPDADLELAQRPDIVFTDVRMLSARVLANVDGEARDLVARLRYVVIDHPNRLSREDLVRLRLAICRLRMTTELLGQRVRFVVILPRIGNHVELAKWLLNNADVEPTPFKAWLGPCELVGWLPPLELRDLDSGTPQVVRSRFADEVNALLSELGLRSHALPDPLRIAIVDSRPLLGPAARKHVRECVEILLRRMTPEDQAFSVRHSWSFFASEDLAVDRQHEFDVVVALGIGSQPEQLVSALRPTLAADGLLVLVADSSPADVESLRLMADPAWDPLSAILSVRYASVVIPDHSEAVIAHELAALFADFRERPVPRDRLRDVFPGEHTLRLLSEWEQRRHVEPVAIFDATRAGRSIELRPYVRCTDRAFSPSRFEVSWGCCSRTVYEVRDRAAHDAATVRRFLQEHVDADRLFIDLHPHAVLRYPPNTVAVAGRSDRALTPAQRQAARERSVVLGRIEVSTPDWQEAVRIDRRVARFDRALREERPFARERGAEPAGGPPALPPLAAALRTAPADGSERSEAEAQSLARERAAYLVRHIERPEVSGARADRRVALLGGTWVVRLSETLRDVVRTDERLVEEPAVTHRMTVADAAGFTRTFETVGTSLFLAAPDGAPGAANGATVGSGDGAPAGPAGGDGTGPAGVGGAARASGGRPSGADGGDGQGAGGDGGAGDGTRDGAAGGSDPLRPDLPAALASYAAHHGLARAIGAWLARRVIGFDREFRFAVVPNEARPEGLSAWRILLYRLRRDELGAEHDSVATSLWRPQVLQELVPWLRERLQSCDCRDGCARCCGGLGAVPEADGALAGHTERDQVSRRKAYVLACGLLGAQPDWDAFYRGVVGDLGDGAGRVTGSDEELLRLVIEVLGTPAAEYRDGIWHRLFGDSMRLSESFVAPAVWAAHGGGPEGAAGWYSPASNRVYVRPNYTRDTTREILVHEYAHNWQFEGGAMDMETHSLSPMTKQFFEGKLVIEGHATWADHRFLFHKGLGGCYEPGDHRPWNEYKVGYFLVEGIEKAVGERGLFEWLRHGPHSQVTTIRSRNPRLPWPFHLEQALDALDLRERARSGRFTDFDVSDTPPGEPQPPPPGEPDMAPPPAPGTPPAPAA